MNFKVLYNPIGVKIIESGRSEKNFKYKANHRYPQAVVWSGTGKHGPAALSVSTLAKRPNALKYTGFYHELPDPSCPPEKLYRGHVETRE